MTAGTSSFGMSGVNAHGLFTSPRALTHVAAEVDWEQDRHWMAPTPHHMLTQAQYSRQAGQCRWEPSCPTPRHLARDIAMCHERCSIANMFMS